MNDGVDRALSRFRRITIAAQIERNLPKPTIDDDDIRPDPHALPGDAMRLRGIPVVGARGAGGAIPGTKPA